MKKLIISSSSLKPVLIRLSQAINPKHILPVLSNIHCNVEHGFVTLTGTDTGITISEKIACESNSAFEMLLPFNFINKVVAIHQSVPLVIEFTPKEVFIETGLDNYVVKLGFKIADFPKLPEVRQDLPVELLSPVIDSLNKALITVGKNNAREQFNYVLLDVKDDSATVVSSEGGNLLYSEQHEIKSAVEEELLISPAAIKAIGDGEPVTLFWDEKFIAFHKGDLKVFAIKTEHKFVAYRSIFNDNHANVIVNRLHLQDALHKCLMVNDPLHTVDFSINGIGMVAKSDDSVLKVNTNIVLEKECEPIEISVNGFKLSLLLKQIETENVGFAIIQPEKPVMLYAIGNDHHKAMIMPLKKGGNA